jgi:tRNA A37 threonylcarbamoyladenosine dehydratase
MAENSIFHRTSLLVGDDVMRSIHNTRVIIFGVGGVGSWCAEALIRSGIGNLTIVDNDVICITNVNRQMQATSENVGTAKIEALKERLLSINPDAEITALRKVYNSDTRAEFNLSEYDYVIDAIDTLSCKIELISHSLASETTLFSAMGAACKLDATRIQVTSIWESNNCRLAKLVRKRLRQNKIEGDFLCIWSEEVIPSASSDPNEDGKSTSEGRLKQVNGSIVHITGTFGFMLAGLVIQDVKSHYT